MLDKYVQKFDISRSEFQIPRVPVEYLIPRVAKITNEKPRMRLGNETDSDYSSRIIEKIKHPETKDFLSGLKGQIVIDLGPGRNLNGYLLACISGAKAYIGVEPFHFKDLDDSLTGTNYSLENFYKTKAIPAAMVNEGMENFLPKVPTPTGTEAPISIMAFGLDNFILTNQKIIEDTQKEIARIILPNGNFIKYDSVLSLNTDFAKKTFKDEYPNSEFMFQPRLFVKYKSAK